MTNISAWYWCRHPGLKPKELLSAYPGGGYGFPLDGCGMCGVLIRKVWHWLIVGNVFREHHDPTFFDHTQLSIRFHWHSNVVTPVDPSRPRLAEYS